MRQTLCSILGMVGAGIASIFGGWDAAMTTLVIFMAIDYITGIIVAGVFHNSKKSKSGSLKSTAGWKGLCKKGVELLIVLVSYRLDLLMNTTYIKDCTVIAFIVNETISILENVGLMGVPLPGIIVKAVDILSEKSKGGTDNNEV